MCDSWLADEPRIPIDPCIHTYTRTGNQHRGEVGLGVPHVPDGAPERDGVQRRRLERAALPVGALPVEDPHVHGGAVPEVAVEEEGVVGQQEQRHAPARERRDDGVAEEGGLVIVLLLLKVWLLLDGLMG